MQRLDNRYPDYHSYSGVEEEDLIIIPAPKLFSRYVVGSSIHYFITYQQRQQIKRNIKSKLWEPTSIDSSKVNLAEIPISQEEAILNAIPEHRERDLKFKGVPINIAVGYTYHPDILHITPRGNWQFVPKIPFSQLHFLGYRPNPNWLPYNI